MKENWWKILASVLVIYSVWSGMLGSVPELPILHETIRNLYFHVPMWFTMVILYLISVIYSIKYLSSGNENHDLLAVECVNTGVVFGFLGLVTGMIWGNYTWGSPWPNDPKMNSAAISTLMYLAYLVLRNSLEEEQKRARISAVYNIFAFPVMIVLLFILPRLTDSLHPGNGGNPGFSSYDLDSRMRMVFYPACIGWILIGVWIATIQYRLRKLQNKQLN
ncbi:Cytochrome c-type biogeneis protein CcmC, putative heme lyase for CcmE [Arcticibacter svalbardensis MN12-7]|uniref:Heme exporter protein C n=1 Tax=Arcticibacter svalbardensis MN12-7 TaxID=1150600 RepID=R9GQI7_9SPHI|nr:cytochrome c biogenesis protein [Arcticibacter svalbardensis]EOR93800.1 Cytochrome c-type biogeneis protein CcmC, putative heme lyase for CcmE [Arcticibacter svalbardensis MN12-7]